MFKRRHIRTVEDSSRGFRYYDLWPYPECLSRFLFGLCDEVPRGNLTTPLLRNHTNLTPFTPSVLKREGGGGPVGAPSLFFFFFASRLAALQIRFFACFIYTGFLRARLISKRRAIACSADWVLTSHSSNWVRRVSAPPGMSTLSIRCIVSLLPSASLSRGV